MQKNGLEISTPENPMNIKCRPTDATFILEKLVEAEKSNQKATAETHNKAHAGHIIQLGTCNKAQRWLDVMNNIKAF